MNTMQPFPSMIKFLWFTSLLCVHLALASSKNHEGANFNTIEKWKLIDHKIKEMSDFVIEKLSSLMMKNENNLNITLKCTKESFKLLKSFRNREPWAIKFIDSSSKMIDSLMGGTTSSLGAYDECLDIKVTSKTRSNKKKISGQYCLIQLAPTTFSEDELQEFLVIAKNISQADIETDSISDTITAARKELISDKEISLIRFGVCVPSGCSEEDVRKISSTIAEKFYLNGRVHCQLRTTNEYSTTQILTLSYYIFIGLAVLTGTLLDIYCRHTNISFSSKVCRIVLGFSFVSNSKKILDTNEEADKLSCIHGIRFITCCWIIFAHVFVYQNMFLNHSAWPTFKDFAEDISFQVVMVHIFPVDTFFFLSGFLAAYQNLRRKNNFSAIYYICNRIFRLLPIYISIIMFTFIESLLSSGPMWNNESTLKICLETWWRNVLFIHNFFPTRERCLPHTWYLSADLQLYIAAIVIILPLLRWPSAGITLGIFGTLLSMIYNGAIIYAYNLVPVNIYNMHFLKQTIHFFKYYCQPFIHAGIFCIGLLAAKFFINNQKLKLSKKIQAIGWITAIVPNIIFQYYPVVWNRSGVATLPSFIAYGAFCRTCWGMGLAWVIVCCSTENGGVVKSILSWKAFVPLSRLTFAAYLIHPIMQVLYLANSRTLGSLSYLSVVWLFFPIIFGTFLIAFGCSVMIEMPFMNMQNILWPRKVSKREDTKCNPLDFAANYNSNK